MSCSGRRPWQLNFTADQQWKHCSFFSVETHGLPRPRPPEDSGCLTAWWLAGTHGAFHTGEASGCVLEMLRSRGKESKVLFECLVSDFGKAISSSFHVYDVV